MPSEYHLGAAIVGIVSLLFMLTWDRFKGLKSLPIPSALLVVIFGTALASWISSWGGSWVIEASHRVEVPVSKNFGEFVGFLRFPDFSRVLDPAVYSCGVVLALIASLETLLNLQAVDKLDRYHRESREIASCSHRA